MKIRSITVFANIAPEIDQDQLARLGGLAADLRDAYTAAGFTVQTTRLATRVLAALSASPAVDDDPIAHLSSLEAACEAHGFEYLSLGPAGGGVIAHIPEILARTHATFATAHIVDPGTGAIDGHAIAAAARVIRQAAEIEEGFGNLRFAALANVGPGTPFFPAAYADDGPPAFALAMEAADLAVDACRAARNAEDAGLRLTAAIEAEAERLAPLAEASALRFLGIDFSLAPFPTLEASIGGALEALSGGPLGSAGTLAAAAVLAAAIDRARFPHAGFCGLMLPVLEDTVLAQRAAEGRLRIGELLQWSAVCGTGLDTVPIPGDVSEVAVARILFDVAALSARWNKPLTARLMPLPGKIAGDPVHFDFPYFGDGGVVPVDAGEDAKLLSATNNLALTAHSR